MSLYLHCGKITFTVYLGVNESRSQEIILHAHDDEVIYLDSSSGKENNLKLKVISEVKIYRKLWAWIK